MLSKIAPEDRKHLPRGRFGSIKRSRRSSFPSRRLSRRETLVVHQGMSHSGNRSVAFCPAAIPTPSCPSRRWGRPAIGRRGGLLPARALFAASRNALIAGLFLGWLSWRSRSATTPRRARARWSLFLGWLSWRSRSRSASSRAVPRSRGASLAMYQGRRGGSGVDRVVTKTSLRHQVGVQARRKLWSGWTAGRFRDRSASATVWVGSRLRSGSVGVQECTQDPREHAILHALAVAAWTIG